MTITSEEENAQITQTVDLGYSIIDHILAETDTPRADKAEPIDALALALVTWVAGPEGKVSAEDLCLIIESINDQVRIQNSIEAEKEVVAA
jgi:hypothetical protein